MTAALSGQFRRPNVSTIRKYRRAKAPKKALFTIDRTLFVGFIGLGALGLAQPAIVSMAFNDTTPATTMTAQAPAPASVIAARPTADFTPVGSIERGIAEPKKPAEAPANPHGLRLSR